MQDIDRIQPVVHAAEPVHRVQKADDAPSEQGREQQHEETLKHDHLEIHGEVADITSTELSPNVDDDHLDIAV